MRDQFPEIVERSRTSSGLLSMTQPGEKNGLFVIAKNGNLYICVISDGLGWEHVSVSLNRRRTPTWEEMCWIKNLFFKESETVIQYHPAKENYVNCHPYCLHLWRPLKAQMPCPDSLMVGPKL